MNIDTAQTARLFIGLPLDGSMRKALGMYARQLEPRAPGRYVAPENYHVTLAFLGETPMGLVSQLADCITKASNGTNPIRVSFEGTGHFGKDASATLWAGLTNAGSIEALAVRVRRELDAIRVRYDRKPCKPHITLARKVDVGRAQLPSLAPLEGVLEKVALFHSTRVRGVLTYLPLATIALG